MPHKKATRYDKSVRMANKEKLLKSMERFFTEYPRIAIIKVDNVSSNSFHIIRKDLRGQAEIVFGKKTTLRRFLHILSERNESIEPLINQMTGNIGMIFTKMDMHDLQKKLNELRSPSMARQGAVAPCDVWLQPGPTGLEPDKTTFLQALSITSQIKNNQIEIQRPFHLIHKGEKVTASQAILLEKLNMKPFVYGFIIDSIFEGGVLTSSKVLDVTEDDVTSAIQVALKNIAAFSLQTKIPSVAAVPYTISSGISKMLAFAMAIDYSTPLLDNLKQAAATAVDESKEAKKDEKGKGKDASKAEKKEEPKKEKEPSEDEDDDGLDGFNLFA